MDHKRSTAGVEVPARRSVVEKPTRASRSGGATPRLLLLAIALASGCHWDPLFAGKPGDRNAFWFSLDTPRSISCLLGSCTLDRPILDRSFFRLNVTDEEGGAVKASGLRATSTNSATLLLRPERCLCVAVDAPMVTPAAAADQCPAMTTAQCEDRLLLQAASPGSTDLEFRSLDGQLLDTAHARVGTGSQANVQRTPSIDADVGVVRTGERGLFFVEVTDAGNEQLMIGDGALSWQVKDPAIAQVFPMGADQFGIDALSPGITQVATRGSGFSAGTTLDVR